MTLPCTDSRTDKPWSASSAPSSRSACRMLLSAVCLVPCGGNRPAGYKIESIEGRHHAARKLAEDLAVVSLLLTQQASFEGRDRSGDFYVVDIWKKSA